MAKGSGLEKNGDEIPFKQLPGNGSIIGGTMDNVSVPLQHHAPVDPMRFDRSSGGLEHGPGDITPGAKVKSVTNVPKGSANSKLIK